MITVTPCAKINLGLNVTGKRPDGYHDLETVFYPVPLYDTITIKESGKGKCSCSLNIEGIKINGDIQDNLVVRAYNALAKEKPLPEVEVTLRKNIPTQAGMGGGSADCAYTLMALNMLLKLGLSDAHLAGIAAKLGADCAFFIKSKPCYADGIGDRMSNVRFSLDKWWIMIIKPNINISTKEAFAGIVPQLPMRSCKDIVENEPVEKWKGLLKNDFEDYIFKLHPQLKCIKEALYKEGASYAAMSGSGRALFGLFKNKPKELELNGCRAETMMLGGEMESFPIVDETGKCIGKTTRAYAHSGAKPLHPVVHLHVFNSKGELYLQKRPMWKDIQPGKWDTAVGGHVDFGESINEALVREVREELSITDFRPKPIGHYIFESEVEREFVYAFKTIYDGTISPSAEELEGGRFFDMKEISEDIGTGLFTPNFEKEWLMLFGNESTKKNK